MKANRMKFYARTARLSIVIFIFTDKIFFHVLREPIGVFERENRPKSRDEIDSLARGVKII